MGFECGFETVPRLENITDEQYFYVQTQKYYEKYIVPHSDGFYKSFEDWFKQSYSSWNSWYYEEIECKYPDQKDKVLSYEFIEPDIIDFG